MMSAEIASWNTASYWLKIENFPYPGNSFSALGQGDAFRISGKALQVLKLKSFVEPTVQILWS